MTIRYIRRAPCKCSICNTDKSVKYEMIFDGKSDSLYICNRCLATKRLGDSIKIDLYNGLRMCRLCEDAKLYSNGLQSNEYIHYVNGVGLCYEDGALIGKDVFEANALLDSLEWTHKSEFFLK